MNEDSVKLCNMTDGKYVCLEDFAKNALESLQKSRYDYISDGCNEQFTLKENSEAFKRYRFRPKILRGVRDIDLSTTILGERVSWPVGISPTALHRSADHIYNEGEIATVRAASSTGTLMILSSFSTQSIEDVAAASSPDGLRWMQVQPFENRKLTERLIRRAEVARYKAIVVTVDQPVFGKKYETMRNLIATKYTIPDHQRPVNIIDRDSDTKVNEVTSTFDSSATWENIRWLKSFTRLPLVLKGITTDEQARNAVVYGADAILVSNHGGRQLDYLPATIDALPEVVAAVEGSGVEVYMDGGVRHGTDVFKALARGARAVFIGRPVQWGLACKGFEGAKQVLDILKAEVTTTMALMGCVNVKEIEPSMVVHEDYYKKSKL